MAYNVVEVNHEVYSISGACLWMIQLFFSPYRGSFRNKPSRVQVYVCVCMYLPRSWRVLMEVWPHGGCVGHGVHALQDEVTHASLHDTRHSTLLSGTMLSPSRQCVGSTVFPTASTHSTPGAEVVNSTITTANN